MNDTRDTDAAIGQQCHVCGGRIDEEDGGHIVGEDDTLAYVHADCA